jgi:hypothetical protein
LQTSIRGVIKFAMYDVNRRRLKIREYVCEIVRGVLLSCGLLFGVCFAASDIVVKVQFGGQRHSVFIFAVYANSLIFTIIKHKLV